MKYWHRTPQIFSILFPQLTWHGSRTTNQVYLTFDDGPIPEVTPFVLDCLNEYEAKATFFCVGKNIDENPEVFKRLLLEGHLVGNHSYSHLNGWKVSSSQYIDDIKKCEQAILQFHPSFIKLFRPPYGKITPRQIKLLFDYKLIMWDVISGDFDGNLRKEDCLNNTIKAMRPGSIVVMHDSVKAAPRLYYILPKLLAFMKEKGWQASKLPY